MELFNNRPNFPAEEEQLVKEWKEQKIFKRSVEERPADKSYTFYDGPPFATGLPHYGHLVPSLMKDMVPRFWTMRGFRVERKWGWDCHGLPIENIVEADLGLKAKKDILKLGIRQFNEACESKVLMYAAEWKKTIARYGRWVDMENDYRTMDLSYMESLWWVFKSLWNRGLIYEGKKSMHICPRCETPLSNFEVTQGYKEVKDVSVVWKFPLANDPKTFLLAWTTTPWSTPSTMGLSVGPMLTYIKVRVGTEFVIFAKERLEFVLKDIHDYEIVEEMKGSALEGVAYEPILSHYKDLPDVRKNPNAYKVWGDDYVEVTEGTGVVTINGAYGEIDYIAAKKHKLPIMLDVEMDGRFNAWGGKYQGMDVRVAQKQLLKDMAAINRVWRNEPYRHSYPHCWRCETPLLNYMTSSWFIKVTAIKDQLLQNNNTIHWVPSHMKEGRFGQWLSEAKDWAVSRTRYWGTPLPVWRNVDDPKDILCMGSVAELEQLSGKKISNLHKHIVDEIVIEKDGKTYRRIPEVLDCWFESGSMPYAQQHYPFENSEKFLQSFPAAFIAEAQDQTRGWFYTLHVLATALTSGSNPAIPMKHSTPAFQHVIVNGIVLAEDGKKMSKRLKNYPEPDVMFHKYGADSVRYYLATSPVMKAENLNFSEKGVSDVFRRTVLTLWNVMSFYKLYEQGHSITSITEPSHVLDQWILAKLQQLVREITDGYESYDLNSATRPLDEFIQEFSTWYVRRSRDRLKLEGTDRDQALVTLREVLLTLSKLLAPVMPFLAELVYRHAGGANKSVHLESWPVVQKRWENPKILEEMDRARGIIEAAHALRAREAMKVRQPLAMCETTIALSQDLTDIVQHELNVKRISVVSALSSELAINEEQTVGLNTRLSDALKQEGLFREVVRNVNMLRKRAGLNLHDRITLVWKASDPDVQTSLNQQKEELARGTLAERVTEGEVTELPHTATVQNAGLSVTVGF